MLYVEVLLILFVKAIAHSYLINFNISIFKLMRYILSCILVLQFKKHGIQAIIYLNDILVKKLHWMDRFHKRNTRIQIIKSYPTSNEYTFGNLKLNELK